MIDEKKLIENIKECYTEEFLAEYGFDKLVQAQPKVSEWIPCGERHPSEEGDYLVCFRTGYIEISTYENESFRDQNEPIYPIAWMPLPEPFKEG